MHRLPEKNGTLVTLYKAILHVRAKLEFAAQAWATGITQETH